MEKVFLDVNVLIDLVEKRKELNPEDLSIYTVFISPLSVHILTYVTKQKVPSSKISDIIKPFYIVALDEDILNMALTGPTDDFEDNVHLHSAAEADSDLFLTSDQKLLKMKFFGKTKIKSSLSS